MKIHLTSLLKRCFKGNETFVVSRSNKAYSFFYSEYPFGLNEDPKGNYIINEDSKSEDSKSKITDRIIKRGTTAYSYFQCEYRQNSPVRDANGDIILYDEIVKRKTR